MFCSLSLQVRVCFLSFAALLTASGQPVFAAAPRALPEGRQPDDSRLAPPKDLNGYFPFEVPASAEEWAKRAALVKRQIAVSQGIWPLPERTPLKAVVYGAVDKGDYVVQKAYFESVPGFFVTGSLYRPKNVSGKMPGVLFPHGHWNDGRFIDIGRQAVRKEIVIGSERFEEGGRSLLQALPVQLARMGCVCFHYDMIGYADCQQLSFELGHKFAKQRPEMNSAESWGLFSPQAEARLQSIMGLQTWNSVRALDFLLSLPMIDEKRIAVTGASGGGTQTMLLAGIDPRVTASFPAVMVSTAMQGGCTCENASCLRVETGNIEFAALFAPKPQGMTAANDWTKELATKGFPELVGLYKLLGAEKNVQLAANTHFNHNYNYVSRCAFYAFLNKHLKLGLEEPVVEEDYQRLTREEMTVWDAAHPKPESGPEFETRLCRELALATDKQLQAIAPRDQETLAKWREVVGGAIETIAGGRIPPKSAIEFERKESHERESYYIVVGLLRNKADGSELPIVTLHPNSSSGRAVICLSERGKSALFGDDGLPAREAKALLDAGILVVGVDLLGQGEFCTDEAQVTKNRVVQNKREFAGYTYGYNRSLVTQRAQDVLTVVAFARNHEQLPTSVELMATDGTAPAAVLALAQAGGAVDRAAIHTGGFRFAKLSDYLDASFLPGGAKYGDLPGMLALVAPAKLWLSGESSEARLVKEAYRAAGASAALVLDEGKGEGAGGRALAYIVKAE